MKLLQNECKSGWKTKLRGQISILGNRSVHVRCFTELCPCSALLSIFLMTWMMEKRICLINLHVDDMLRGTSYRLDTGLGFKMMLSVWTCHQQSWGCKSKETATPIPSCMSRSDVWSASEGSSILLSIGNTSWGLGRAPWPKLDATLQKKSGSTERVAEGLGVNWGLWRHLERTGHV